MKNTSLLLTTLALASAFANAQTANVNFYTKAGIDLTSRFETIEITSIAAQDKDNNLFVSSPSRKNTFSPSIFLETTYNILPQTELGFGLGYIKRRSFDYQRTIKDRENVDVREIYKVNRYASIPLYLTLKQNYSLTPNTTLYVKSDLGYSFNKTSSTVYNEYRLDKPDHRVNVINFKTKDGLYLGVGVGIEYKSFLAELGYYHTNSAVTYNTYQKFGAGQNPVNTDVNRSYNNDALRFTVGLKF